jgi:hypothetical protein
VTSCCPLSSSIAVPDPTCQTLAELELRNRRRDYGSGNARAFDGAGAIAAREVATQDSFRSSHAPSVASPPHHQPRRLLLASSKSLISNTLAGTPDAVIGAMDSRR